MASRESRLGLALLALVAWTSGVPLRAAQPEFRTVNVRGLQIGGSTTLVVEGDHFGVAPRLLLPFAGKQTLRPGFTDKLATFDVILEDAVPPGFHHLRVVTTGGVSLPVLIGVDRLPQQLLAATVDRLPVAMHGNLAGSTVAETTFSGKAGQKVMVEVEARRLGSGLRPVVHLYGPGRLQAAWSWSTPCLLGDTRLEATLPTDGAYTVALHDAEYAAPAPGFFRLKIGQWSFVDQVFPPVAGKDQRTVELIGSTPSRSAEPPALGNHALLPLAWPKDAVWSGLRPFVEASRRPELVGHPGNGKTLDLPSGPLGISGRLLAPFEEQRYRLPTTPGSKVRFEVFAERLGSPLDIALVVRNEAGAELARAEDSAGTLDPALEFTVPEKTAALQVAVVESQGRADSRGVYRLTVDPVSPAGAAPDFQLHTSARRVALAAGGRAVVPVWLERRGGHAGVVELSAEGLPSGVKLEGVTIPADGEGALVMLLRGEPAGGAAITTWRGRGADGQERALVLRGHPLERRQPWLATELAVAPISPPKDGPFSVEWRGLTADAGLVLAGKLTLPVKVQRSPADAAVRLSLLTSQPPPVVNNQPDPSRAIRPEKPVELAAKATDGDIIALIPPELTGAVYDVAVQAELLSLDKQTVLEIACTPVRRLAVRLPLALRLEGPSRIEAQQDLKTGVTIAIVGLVERREGAVGDVIVGLTGLPAGGRADPVTVKAGETKFSVQVVLPPSVPVGALPGWKLTGTIAPDPKQPGVRVRSRDVELTVNVRAPSK